MPTDLDVRDTSSSAQQAVQQATPVQDSVEHACSDFDVASGSRGWTMIADEDHPDARIPFSLARDPV